MRSSFILSRGSCLYLQKNFFTNGPAFIGSVLLLAVSFFIFSAASRAEGAENEEPLVRALIITGQDYPGHVWQETTPALVEALAADSRVEVRVVQDPHFLDSAAIHDYDLVVLHFMDWEQPAPGEKARSNLQRFVSGGKGLFLIHFACGAFQDWPEFQKIAGRIWDPELRPHDPYGSFVVEISSATHPITVGLESFETTDELYTCLVGDVPVEMLATSCSKVDGKDYPMAFAFHYEKGRVFHSPLGHDAQAFRTPGVAELFRRGAAWAAGLSPVPNANDKVKGEEN